MIFYNSCSIYNYHSTPQDCGTKILFVVIIRFAQIVNVLVMVPSVFQGMLVVYLFGAPLVKCYPENMQGSQKLKID